ncbi:hypothetical protein ACLOJK_036991 [Asimina triloba]
MAARLGTPLLIEDRFQLNDKEELPDFEGMLPEISNLECIADGGSGAVGFELLDSKDTTNAGRRCLICAVDYCHGHLPDEMGS